MPSNRSCSGPCRYARGASLHRYRIRLLQNQPAKWPSIMSSLTGVRLVADTASSDGRHPIGDSLGVLRRKNNILQVALDAAWCNTFGENNNTARDEPREKNIGWFAAVLLGQVLDQLVLCKRCARRAAMLKVSKQVLKSCRNNSQRAVSLNDDVMSLHPLQQVITYQNLHRSRIVGHLRRQVQIGGQRRKARTGWQQA